jgi:CheY-like chemotaxis protein
MVDNFQVLEAETGDEALEMIRKDPPDLVILDVKMPGTLDGLSLTARLKEEEATRHIPVFLLTAVPLQLPENGQARPDAVFYKPFSPMDLLDHITGLFKS